MEKLILRSVMYGADKIPDTWFEKVPGGFYKKKEEEEAKARDQAKRDSKKSGKDGSGGGSRPSNSDSRNGGGGRSRRYSTGEDDKRPSDPPRRRDGERQRQRESYDGQDQDDGHYSGDDRRRRRNHGSTRQRRRSFDDDREYSHGNGPPPPRDNRRDERRMNDGAPYPERDTGPSSRARSNLHDSAVGAAALTGASMGLAEGASRPYDDHAASGPQSGSEGRKGVAGGYVPYAHIYGGPASQAQREPYSTTPPQSSAGSAQPTERSRQGHQVAPPPSHYHQNPYALDTAAAAAGYRSQDSGYDSRHDHRHDDRYNSRDERSSTYSDSPLPRRGHSRRDNDSPTHDSRAEDDRSTRPDRRQGTEGSKRAKSQGGGESRGKYRTCKTRADFDGIEDSWEVPPARTAAVRDEAVTGALIADKPEARDRYVPAGYQADYRNETSSPSNATPTMKPVDPRKPLGAQMGGDSGSGTGGSSRRRDGDRAQRQYGGDGAHGKRSSGYYSD
ncbi:hypothetical protein LTR91_017164 [Friedmanniomyces endolithicus]|uniref:Uncharacterized protein n=1 Tax=Friedmanniomyces endolithicus TaxID=329885 RepID=A0AAN6QJU1_9PEZI|nr:hypothetical protein LTR82_017325 [Friedmanniomyces endolithicus]KAK0308424.1 hypothetical protein LTR01_005051 [Friedmanniomyces endolithicus]KAK0829345.1 hypothetical protein LTR73_004289 [Friedmanniomyces endolithicus]KAK0910415.1 hypothetical protein LTR57_015856 [Friedmanniomyces endolithicus]KAK0967439.1 hypothetical protein LTR91_017164 [Friedmanniomyces endolithicus]